MEHTLTIFQRMWHSILFGGAKDTDTRKTKDQAYVVNTYSLIAMASAVAFGALHLLVENNPVIGALELVCSLLILLNMVWLRQFHNVTIARTGLLLVIMMLMMVLLISGGTKNTGIFWLFVFPIVTFFLVGTKQGIRWVGGFYVLIALVAAASYFSLIDIPYPLIAIRQLLVSLTVVGAGVYIYQQAREAALSEVEESQRDLQEYLDQMTTYSIKVGIDGRVLFANKVAKNASGLNEQLVGTKFLDGKAWAVNEAARKRTEEAFYEALTGKRVKYDEQMKIASSRGYTLQTVNFHMIPIFKGQRIKYVLVEALDISAEREAERTKTEFVALASEQLRPSISSITTAIEQLRSLPPESISPEQQQAIQQVSQNNQHISSAINKLLLVSGLELGNLPVKPTPTNIITLCQTALAAVRSSHLQRRILEINEDYASGLPEVTVDPELMRTVLYSLISNAVKFTPDSGRINIRISQTEQKLAHGSKGSLQIEVQDSGHGIPVIDQEKVFTKFFRVRSSQAPEAEGSGQSLYIIKKLLDYVGGSITFTSRENVGTIFIVLIPLEGMTEH